MNSAKSALNSLCPGRRSLQHDFPKGAEARTYWSCGPFVGPQEKQTEAAATGRETRVAGGRFGFHCGLPIH